MTQLRILVTAVGGRAAYSFIRCLKESYLNGRLYFIGADMDPYSSSVFCDDFVTIPSPREENYVNEVQRISNEKGVGLVVPTSDEECLAFSKNCNNGNINLIPMGSYDSVLSAKDKLRLYEVTKDLDVVHKTVEIRKGSSIGEIQEIIGLPAFLKPRMGRGGRFTHIVKESSPDEERSLRNYWESFREDYGSPICQKFINSADYGIDMFINGNGEINFGAMRRKLKVITGERAVGMHSVSIYGPEMEDVSREIVKRLGLKGMAEIEMRREAGKFYAIDVNPRVGGSIYLSKLSGRNIALLPILDFLHEPYPDFDYRTGVEMRRQEIYWDYVSTDGFGPHQDTKETILKGHVLTH
jgi:predicted ATP-grasp superfamily ATP-dependent carboligase